MPAVGFRSWKDCWDANAAVLAMAAGAVLSLIVLARDIRERRDTRGPISHKGMKE